MKKYFFVLCTAAAATVLSAATIDIRPVKEKIWKVGEKVAFTSTVLGDDGKPLKAGSYTLTVTNSGGQRLGKPYKVDISKSNPFNFSAALKNPGFIMVLSSPFKTPAGKTVRWANRVGVNAPHCGVPVEPEKIRPGEGTPADFDKFWRDGVALFKKAPVRITPEKKVLRKGYNVFRITVGFPDKSGAIDGFLAIPQKKGKYPLVVSFPGAGPGFTGARPMYSPCIQTIALNLNVHKFPSSADRAEQKKRFDRYNTTFPDKKSYIVSQAWDRDKYIFRNVWLAMNRAVDYVAANIKEFDGKHAAAVGSSQGGATALVLSYLNKNITCAVANVPGFCDHSGWKVSRRSGGPNIYGVWKKKAAESIRYFDCANFAPGIKKPVLMSAGFADMICVPSSVYAAFNNLKGPKRMHHMLRSGHAVTQDFSQAARKFLETELTR